MGHPLSHRRTAGNNRAQNQLSKVPGIGDIPIIRTRIVPVEVPSTALILGVLVLVEPLTL